MIICRQLRSVVSNIIIIVMMMLIVAVGFFETAIAARVLGLFPHASEGHFAVMRTLMMELARREYNVTLYSSHRLDERIDNLEEHIVEPEFQFWTALQKNSDTRGGLPVVSQLSEEKLERALAATGAASVDHFLSNAVVRDLLQQSEDLFDYDLVIVDLFYTEALLAVGYYYNVPTIGVVTSDFGNYMQKVQESIVPTACPPLDFDNYTEGIGFWERLRNVRQCMSRRKQFASGHFALQEGLIRRHFAHIKAAAPTMAQLHSHLAVLLLNNHVPLAIPRPLLQNTIPVGGLQIRAARELPWHIRRFLDEARSGAIYMHLGNEQLCSELPQDKLRVLFNVFGKRQERVLWTCHDEQKLEGLPENMMIQHMVPQTDILAHPHIKVFVMNGDLLGLQEGIVRHVPLLGIPLFRNEQRNVALAERLHIAVRVDYANLTEQSLTWALQTLLQNEAYVRRIREVSIVFRDRPLGGLATTMYWVDYVLRHKGAPLIQTPGVGMPLNYLHLFDLFVFYFMMGLLVVGLLVALYFVAMFLWRRRQVEKMYSKLN